MKQEFWHENTSVSCINYHFVWCVRRRKKLLSGEIDKRLLELIPVAVEEIGCKVIALASHLDHVRLFVQAQPILAPYQIMHKVKGYTAFHLRREFASVVQKLPSLWTRSYFVGTAGAVSGDAIKHYVEAQKTRG